MKIFLLGAAVAVLVLAGLLWFQSSYRASSAPKASMSVSMPLPRPSRLTGPPLAGRVLAKPFRVLRNPTSGHITRVHVSENQPVKKGDLLLTLFLGNLTHHQISFTTAPAAGTVSISGVSAGAYLPAGAPYARLTAHSPVHVRVAAAAAAQLHPGDSLRVLAGPTGLAGVTTPLTAILPPNSAVPADSTVLVLGRQGWPPATAVSVVLAPLRQRIPSILVAQ